MRIWMAMTVLAAVVCFGPRWAFGQATIPEEYLIKPKPVKPATPGPASLAPLKQNPKPGVEPTTAKPEDAAKVKNIILKDVHDSYVSSKKAGQLFMIEGKAVNTYKTPKGMILLEATLYDAKGDSLASQKVLAGNSVSLRQLQSMTRDEVKNALTSKGGVLSNNTNIASGSGVWFMIVFFDPPDAIKEFGVKVVDAQDPPRQ